MLNELIAYVILPDTIRFLTMQEGGEEVIEKQARTDFLNQKVILLNCAESYRVHELEIYMQTRIGSFIKSKGGVLKPTTIRKYVDYALSNLFLVKIANVL